MTKTKNVLRLLILAFFLIQNPSCSQKDTKDTINVYGPGGPYPAINEAAKIYSKKNNIKINVVKGPVSKWKKEAEKNADIIYSGSEFMMTNFINEFPIILQESVYPLYLRKSGLLVRPGNPKKINKLSDILKPGINVMIVSGAGLTGVWEDMIGKTKSIDNLKMLRKNIIFFAKNSGVAKNEWIKNDNIDVWITWNIWQVSNSNLADFIPVNEEYTLYRDCGIALTKNSKDNKKVKDFFEFLKSKEVKAIFKKWGWITE